MEDTQDRPFYMFICSPMPFLCLLYLLPLPPLRYKRKKNGCGTIWINVSMYPCVRMKPTICFPTPHPPLLSLQHIGQGFDLWMHLLLLIMRCFGTALNSTSTLNKYNVWIVLCPDQNRSIFNLFSDLLQAKVRRNPEAYKQAILCSRPPNCTGKSKLFRELTWLLLVLSHTLK